MDSKVGYIIRAIVHILKSCMHLMFAVQGQKPSRIDILASRRSLALTRVRVVFQEALSYTAASWHMGSSFRENPIEVHYTGAYNCVRWFKPRRESITQPQEQTESVEGHRVQEIGLVIKVWDSRTVHMPAHSTLKVLTLPSASGFCAFSSPPRRNPFFTPVPRRPPTMMFIKSISSSHSAETTKK